MLLRFNINWNVRIKLNDWGRQIYTEHYAKYGMVGERAKVDAEGWTREQLWWVMEVFGPHMGNGMKAPFDTEIELLPETKDES